MLCGGPYFIVRCGGLGWKCTWWGETFHQKDVIDTMKSYAVLGASQNTGLTLFYDGLDTKLVYFSILDTRRQVG